tara:strand:+ start:6133 stop:6243 length:111 start_codon:yes stop_codon:yes gene_type:complete
MFLTQKNSSFSPKNTDLYGFLEILMVKKPNGNEGKN